MSQAKPATERVVFPARVAPIGIFFVVVPALVVVLVAVAVWRVRLPMALVGLLLAVAACCVVLAKSAVEEMAEVVVEWSSQGVTVRRLLGTESYYWSHVERVALFDPGATFGDFGRHEEKRAAIGIHIRSPGRKTQPADSPPDVMIVSRVGEAAEKLPKLVERLSNAKRFGGGGKDSRKLVGHVASTTRSSKEFRRTPNSSAA